MPMEPAGFLFPRKENKKEKTVSMTIERSYAFVNDRGARQLIVESLRAKTGNW